jgi:hypothetical protein
LPPPRPWPPSPADDHGRRGATGGGHGEDDGATSTGTHTSTSSRAATIDDHGSGVEPGDDSGGHGGRTGSDSSDSSDSSGKGSGKG